MGMDEKLDYREIGLTVGLEIHQQLDTRAKLFCNCPTRLASSIEGAPTIYRRLRAGKSELGEVDPAALFEYMRGRLFEYIAPRDSVCLVELDEEPPHDLNREAVAIALAVALALGAEPVDEIHVMRKIVVDGSNTSGFQRTAIVALGGSVDDDEGSVGIRTITLEEDSARKVRESDGVVTYCLDRLGIPLIEISTAPDIHSPEQAERVAQRIGLIMRLTGRVKRGLGTIRQDLNISIRGGAKIEVKGVQRLDLISRVVALEALRQYRLLKLRDELASRGIDRDSISIDDLVDVTELFRDSKVRFIKRVIDRGGVVMALPLRGFKGLLGWSVGGGRRFGSELADYARQWGGVGGLIHSDELPNYGIDSSMVDQIYRFLDLDPGSDAFILISDQRDRVLKAFRAVVERIRAAFDGVPEETRVAADDGTTRYMRPQPGAARMYPETDIPPVRVDSGLLEEARKLVPEPFEVKFERFVRDHGLSRDLAKQLIRSHYLPLYEDLVSRFSGRIDPQLIAVTLINTLKALRSEGVDVSRISEETLTEVFDAYSRGLFSKEAIPDVLRGLAQSPGESVESIVERLGLGRLSMEDLERIVSEVLRSEERIVRERGERAFSAIMGRVMARVRGRVDGRVVSQVVRRMLSEFLSGS